MDQSKPSTPEEKEGVKKIHRKVFLILILMVLYLPVVVLTYILTHSNTVARIMAFIFFITLVCLGSSMALAKCPRCGTSLFFSSFPYCGIPLFYSFLTYKCKNCGLRI